MSIINQFKREINFAIFSAIPPNWANVNNPHDWHALSFSSEMKQCQLRINAIKGNFSKIHNDEGKEKIKKLKEDVKRKIEELKGKAKKAEEPFRYELKLRIKELEKAIPELEALEKTITKYNFKINKDAPQLNYDNETDTITIQYNGTTGSLINELKHAFQFETGKIDFIKVKNEDGSTDLSPGVLYDLNDEVETYKRQYAFDGYLKMRLAWTEEEINSFYNNNFNELANELFSITSSGKDSFGVLEVKTMKFVTADIIVKIKDTIENTSTLYNTLSKKSLDKNSKLRAIQKANKNRKDLDSSFFNFKNHDNKMPYIEFVKIFIKEKPLIYVK